MSRLFAPLFLLCLCLGIINGDFSCDPITDCLKSYEGGLVPDPADCEAYYECIQTGSYLEPSPTSYKCPLGKFFSGYTGICEPETTIGICDEDFCNGPHSGICRTSCTADNQKIGYPGDCSRYFECISGEIINGTCESPKPYFNGDTCVSLAADCCDFCKPYCFLVGSEVADPYNCSRYYICMEFGTVQEQFHFNCTINQHFDAPQGKCVAGASCNSMC